MTYLFDLFDEDVDLLKKYLSNSSTHFLIDSLDTTLQFDVLKVSNEVWSIEMQPEKSVYDLIISELKRRALQLDIE